MVRGRGDEAHALRRVPVVRDVLADLEARQLAALACCTGVACVRGWVGGWMDGSAAGGRA